FRGLSPGSAARIRQLHLEAPEPWVIALAGGSARDPSTSISQDDPRTGASAAVPDSSRCVCPAPPSNRIRRGILRKGIDTEIRSSESNPQGAQMRNAFSY